MIIYLFLVVSIFATTTIVTQGNLLIRKKNEKYLFIVWFLLLTLISGLRGENVGTDTFGYILRFNIVSGETSGIIYQEQLFTALMELIGKVSKNPQFFLLICSAIISIGVLVFIKNNSDHKTLSTFLYVALYFYFMSMNGIRQFVSISILLLSIEFAKKRKFILFILIYLLAVGIHYSSFVGIIFWWICKVPVNGKKMVGIGIAFVACLLASSYVVTFVNNLFPSYSIYISEQGTYTNTGIMLPIVYVTIFIGGLIASRDISWRTNNNMILLCMSEIAALWSLISPILGFFDGNITQRIGWVFQISAICLVPNILKSRYIKYKEIAYFVIIVLGLAYMIYYLSRGWHRVTPYELFIS